MVSEATIRQTADGSFTLYSPDYLQHFHSLHGALTESRHVYIEISGFAARCRQMTKTTVFEAGFGTGLNFWLAALTARDTNCPLTYVAFDQTIPDANLIQTVLAPVVEEKELQRFIEWLDQTVSGWNTWSVPGIELIFWKNRWSPYAWRSWPGPETPHFDFFFYDAFSPQQNPELWSAEVFASLYQRANAGAVLTTYAASLAARAPLAAAGWLLAKAPGPPGKREMTIAAIDEIRLISFDRLNETKLAARLPMAPSEAPHARAETMLPEVSP